MYTIRTTLFYTMGKRNSRLNFTELHSSGADNVLTFFRDRRTVNIVKTVFVSFRNFVGGNDPFVAFRA